MNCANHPDVANVAFCRTCGKPLCANCTRDVRGVIYCENCLAARMEGAPAAPVAGFVPAQSAAAVSQTGPNPTVAGILGAIPFGVGAVYCGQYVKGLVYLGVFVCLVTLESSDVPWFMHMALGLGIAFFWVYQIMDAIRTAKAIQTGQPAPDPFGLAETFGPGQKVDTARVPSAAVVLIGLGLLFLLQTTDIFPFGWERTWPVLLIGLGVWLFAKRQGVLGTTLDRRGRPFRARGMMGPVILLTIGTLFLIQSLGGPDFWGHTWPTLLLAIGITKLFESHSVSKDLYPPEPPAGGGMPEVPQPSSEVKNG